ncbi:MAG: hypothetical protein U1F36_12580 [Planctomycetota bacterium]
MTRSAFDDERLADWVDGELDDVQRQRFEAEMRVNPELRRAAEEYRRMVLDLRQALREGDAAGPGFADRVMARVDADRRGRRFRLVPLLGSAIAAGLLVGLWLFVRDFAARDPRSNDVASLDERRRAPDENWFLDHDARIEDRLQGHLEEERMDDASREATSSSAPESQARVETPSRDAKDDAARLEAGARGFVAPRGRQASGEDAGRGKSSTGDANPSEFAEGIDVTSGLRGVDTDKSDVVLRLAGPPPSTAASPKSDPAVPAPEVVPQAHYKRVDPGSLVLVVELPAAAEKSPEATTTSNLVRASEALGFTSWSDSFVQMPVQQSDHWAANVLPPLVRRLQVEPVKDQDGTFVVAVEPVDNRALMSYFRAAGGDAGAYRPQSGDQVFRLEGDAAQNAEYLKALTPLVAQQNGRIVVQRAFELTGGELAAADLGAAENDRDSEAARENSEAKAPATRREAQPQMGGRGAPPGAAGAVAKQVPASPEKPGQPTVGQPVNQPKGAPDKATETSTWIVVRRRAEPSPPAESAKPAESGGKR